MNKSWVEYLWNDESTHPEQNRNLWYFFDYVGVHYGRYYGEWVFAGEKGFLGGDVTHWQYDEGQGKPERPY